MADNDPEKQLHIDETQGEENNDDEEKRDFKKLTKPDLLAELEQLYDDNRKLKKTHQDLDKEHTSLQTETTILRKQYTESTKSNIDLKSKLKQERDIKDASILELTLAQARLTDTRKLNAEFLAKLVTMDGDGASCADTDRPKVLIAMDQTSAEIMKHINNSEINFDCHKSIHSINDLVKEIENDTFVNSLLQYHKFAICLGSKDIANGASSDVLYKKLHRSLVQLRDKIDIELMLIHIPPNANKMFHVSVFNAKLSNQKMPKVTTVHADVLQDYANDQILADDQITLLPEGAIVLAKHICKSIKLPTQLPKKVIRPAPSDTPTPVAPKSIPEKNYTSSEVSEILMLPDGSVGRIIGEKGAVIKGIREDTGASVRIDTYEEGDTKNEAAYLRGDKSSVEKAKAEILRIIMNINNNKRGSNVSISDFRSGTKKSKP